MPRDACDMRTCLKKIMLAGLNCTLDESLCDSFVKLIDEMELWKWDDATGDFWSSKSTAAEQHLSHVGRAVGQQTGISAYHWKTELGCSN